MRIHEFFKQQHRELEELIRQIESAEDDDERLALRAELGDQLAACAQSKIVVLYPAALGHLGAACRARESTEEITVVCFALDRFLATHVLDDTFAAKLNVLKDVMMNHIEEDECELLPQLEGEVDASELGSLGDDAVTKFEECMRAGRADTLAVIMGRDQPPHILPKQRKRAPAKKQAAGRPPSAKERAAMRGRATSEGATRRASTQGGPKGTVRPTKKATPKRVARAREPIPAKGGTPREVLTQAATAVKKRAAKK